MHYSVHYGLNIVLLSLEAEFDALVREYVILFLLVLLGWVTAHLVVRAIRGPSEVASLPLLLCVLSLGVSLLVSLLPSFTVLADKLIANESVKSHEYLSWMTPSLLQRMWTTLVPLSHLSLLVLLPFAYLYHEADDGAKGLVGRLWEAGVVLALVR